MTRYVCYVETPDRQSEWNLTAEANSVEEAFAQLEADCSRDANLVELIGRFSPTDLEICRPWSPEFPYIASLEFDLRWLRSNVERLATDWIGQASKCNRERAELLRKCVDEMRYATRIPKR